MQHLHGGTNRTQRPVRFGHNRLQHQSSVDGFYGAFELHNHLFGCEERKRHRQQHLRYHLQRVRSHACDHVCFYGHCYRFCRLGDKG